MVADRLVEGDRRARSLGWKGRPWCVGSYEKKEVAFPKRVRETRQSMGGARETAPPGTQLPVRGRMRTVRQRDRGKDFVF